MKAVRGVREIFQIHGNEDYQRENVQIRIKRHKFLIALFETLPQAILQLYETFALGKTFGAFIMFSTTYSILEVAYNEA